MKKCLSILILSSILYACGNADDYKLSRAELYLRATSAATDNNQIITSAEEIIDLTANVLSDEGISNGRESSGRWNTSGRMCTPSVDHSYLIDRTHYDTTLYVGTMTIDFGNGESCSDADNKRTGKIIDDFLYVINYVEETFWSRETITFHAYKKDSVKIDGTFIIYTKSDDPVTIETSDATITYPDGKTASWKGTLNFVSVRNDGQSISNTISGTINGTTKRSEKFVTTITTPIEYKYSCDPQENPVPVKGSIAMDVNNEKSIVNYGDGTCDKVYTLTVDGQQTQHGI